MKQIIGYPLAIKGYRNGKAVAALQLQVSTVDELPHKEEEISGYIVAAGTISNVIRTGQWFTLDDDDNNYNSDGSGKE